MTLVEAVAAVSARPAFIGARIDLARALEASAIPNTLSVWIATVRLAAARGEFFEAIHVCREHLTGTRQAEILIELAYLYGCGGQHSPKFSPPPKPSPREFIRPRRRADLLHAALKAATDIKELLPRKGSFVPEIPIFSELHGDAFINLALAMRPEQLEPEQVLVSQGEPGETMFLLGSGQYVVQHTDAIGETIELARVNAPALIGEIALLTSVPRRASVIAVTESRVWRIDAETIAEVSAQHPQLKTYLKDLVKRRLLNNLLQQSELLRSVHHKDRGKLLGAFQLEEIAPGTEVISQGTPAPGLYIVLYGAAEVWQIDRQYNRALLATLEEGQVFGEMSLLTGQPTNASVLMPDGGIVLHLPVETFRLIQHYGFMPNLQALAAYRSGQRTSPLPPLPVNDGELLNISDEEIMEIDDSWIVEE